MADKTNRAVVVTDRKLKIVYTHAAFSGMFGYSPEEAQRAANKNYVTRALGVEPQVEVEVQEHPVDKGDVYILCSDGLSDMVEDEDIRLTISTFGANLDTVAKQLIQLANENGGRDNVSVVLAQAVEPFPASRGVMDKLLGWFS